MPCRDEYQEQYVAAERIDELTQMLCWLCGSLKGELPKGNKKLEEWWAEHQEADEARVLREMRKEAQTYRSAKDLGAAFVRRARAVHAVSDFHKDWFYQLAERVFKEIAEEKSARETGLAKLTEKEKRALGL